MSGQTFYINYFDQIDAARVKALMSVCTDIVAQKKPETLYFLFSSPGGQVQAGITFYNFLRALPVKVIMHNTGSIDSIATVIFLAGDERFASHSSSFLFHGVQANFPAGAGLTLNQMKERTSGLAEDENKIARVITERSKIENDEIRKLFREGESKGPEFAVEKGFISEIRDAEIPKDAPFITVNIN